MLLAETYRRGGQYDQAIAQYESILKERPGEDSVANNLASLLLDTKTDRGSSERALQLATRFKAAHNLAYIDTLGWAYTRLGQVNEALPLLNRVVEKAPDVAVFQYHLGSALFQKGDRVAAKSLLQKAASSPQEFPGKKEAKGMLEKV